MAVVKLSRVGKGEFHPQTSHRTVRELQFPNQIFTVFSYPPDKELQGKNIIVTGKVTSFNGVPSIPIENEDDIEILE